MSDRSHRFAEVRPILRLALPVALAQLGWMAIGLVDLWMVGRLGAASVAAVALGDLWIVGTSVLGIGIVMGIDPIVAQAHGARLSERMGRALQQGIVIALLLSVPFAVSWFYTAPVLRLLGQQSELAAAAQQFTRIQAFSVAPFLVYVALRQYLQGRGLMMPPLVIVLAANVVNAVLNWGLIFGRLGLPEMGLRGAGLASGLTRSFMMLALAATVIGLRLHEGAWARWSWDAVRPRSLAQVLRFGIPTGAQVGLEVWAFTLTTVIAGWISADALAAHTIVMKIASFSFMSALGIGIACTTRVGNLLGAGEPWRARRAAWTGVILGAGVMALFAVAFVLFRWQLPRLFIPHGAVSVIALGAAVLPVAAAFQIFDGFQAVAGGVLRGMGTPRPAAVINLFCFYGLCLPLGMWLSLEVTPFGLSGLGLGLPGLWAAMAVGLGTVALLLGLWIWRRGPDRAAVRAA